MVTTPFLSAGFARGPEGSLDPAIVPAPLFRCPIFDGACDPSVVWNDAEQAWYVFYTQRRANQSLPGVSWVYRTAVGICRSTDKGKTWDYLGTAQGLTRDKPEIEAFWAPHVFFANGQYHMIVSYVPYLAITKWGGRGRLTHYTSSDLQHWKILGDIDVKSDNVIDPGVAQLRDGRWLLVFRDDNTGCKTAKCVSDDLKNWTRLDDLTGEQAHEAPVLMFWKDRFWMFTDDWKGLGVFESIDGIQYERNGIILGQPGKRTDDTYLGCHPGVAIAGDRAFIFYHCHPERGSAPQYSAPGTESPQFKRSVLQLAELELIDGKIICDRDRYL